MICPGTRIASAGLICLGILGGCLPAVPEPETTSAVVVRVVDGDSLVITLDGAEQRVRLLGVDAPENGECGHREAGERLRELVDGRQIRIVADSAADAIDRYGRILGYIEVAGTDAGYALIAEGYAAAWWPASAVEPDRGQNYLAAMRAAAGAGLGSWAFCQTLGRP